MRDPRDFQIAFLLLFLCLGVWARDWTLQPALMIAVVVSSLATQLVFDRSGWRSALITGISLCLLLRANSVLTMLLAGMFSIASKYMFRVSGKHFFNPSNFGIILVLLLLGDAWVTPGQWGNDVWYSFIFLATGGMIVGKVGRWETTGAFLITYALLEGLRNYWLGWEADVFAHRMISGSLLLFSFFMITDPRAIPDRRIGRVLFALAVALLTFLLRNYWFIPTAPFWALFVLSPVTILLDRIWPSERFQWKKPFPLLTKEGRSSPIQQEAMS